MCDNPVPDIPFMMKVITGDEHCIHQKMEEFFKEVVTFLGYDKKAATVFTKCEYLTTVSHTDKMLLFQPGRGNTGDLRNSETEVALLIVGHAELVVATVVFHRSVFNNVQANFCHYLNDPEVVRCAKFEKNCL